MFGLIGASRMKGQRRSAAYNVAAALFGAGEQGAWYDPSDLSTLFDTSAGSVQASVNGPVGLLLDKLLVLGAELQSAGVVGIVGSATAATYNTATGVGGVTRVDASNQSFVQFSGLTNSSLYRISISGITGGVNIRSGTQAGTAAATQLSGSLTAHVVPAGGQITITCAIAGTATFTLSTIKELPGNHTSQATAASRPVLSARKNLVTLSEGGVTGNPFEMTLATVVEDGRTFTRVTPTFVLVSHYFNSGQMAFQIGTRYTISVDAKAEGLKYLRLHNFANQKGSALYDVLAGTAVVTSQPVDTDPVATITALEDAWFRLSYTFTMVGGADATIYWSPTPNENGTISYAGDSSMTMLMSRIQTEIGSVATRYQRVTTNTDYDTVGFPHYSALDRVDDHLIATTGGGGTTGILLCVGLRAGGTGTERVIWSDRGTNTGYRLSLNTSNQLVLSAGNGTAHTTVTGPTITAGTDYVVMGWHDGTNLHVRVGLAAATSAAFGTATAGTAGFTVGRANGSAANHYGDRIHGLVYRRNDASTGAQRDSLSRYMATQAGVTL